MATLTLYYTDTCLYCQKVLTYMRQAGILIPTKNIVTNPANKQELRKLGGKTQVPCLVIDGKALYESDEIIEWLKDNWKKIN